VFFYVAKKLKMSRKKGCFAREIEWLILPDVSPPF